MKELFGGSFRLPTKAPCRKVIGVTGQRSQAARNVEGRPVACRAALQTGAPLRAGGAKADGV